MEVMKYLYLTVFVFLICGWGCAQLTPEQQKRYQNLESQQRDLETEAAALTQELTSKGERIVSLTKKLADPESLTAGEAAELGGILVTLKADVDNARTRYGEILKEWREAEDLQGDLLEAGGGASWMAALASGAGALLVGMGIPTSGPMAPLFTLFRGLGTMARPRRMAVKLGENPG
ncbi:MAG: hypothetical protein DWQ01_08550 [Planctomycetota bacterium]|nr:MAG: hypothetical protein DWQ01_08550 [Planctomycetota bacterium]